LNILLTYDYELFFGSKTGTVEKCLIQPTNILRNMAHRTGIKLVFFVDVGFLKQLENFRHFPAVEAEYVLVKKQICELADEGHDCQLHIHPHWEDSVHDGTSWKMNTQRYKLDDFSDQDIYRIVGEYKAILEKWTEKPVHSYRAGGWCLQPFWRVKKAFTDFGIRTDSTVFHQGKFTAGNYYYDFTSAPDLSSWHFNEDLCKSELNGTFREIPIAAYFYKPLFFWKLFALGRLKPFQHKPIGDGFPMDSPGLRKRMLTTGMQLSGCTDGYFVTKMQEIADRNEKKGFPETVFIGHPKACTAFAVKKLEEFITTNRMRHRFVTFSDLSQ